MRNYCDVSCVLRDSASSNPTILYRAHCITHASWNLLRVDWITNDKIIFSDIYIYICFALIPPDTTGDPVLPFMNFGCFSRPSIFRKTQDCNDSRQNRPNPLRMSAVSIRFSLFRVEKRAVLFPYLKCQFTWRVSLRMRRN